MTFQYTARTQIKFWEKIPYEQLLIHGSYPEHQIRYHIRNIITSSRILSYLLMDSYYGETLDANKSYRYGVTVSGAPTKMPVYPENIFEYMAGIDDKLSTKADVLAIKSNEILVWAICKITKMDVGLVGKLFEDVTHQTDKIIETLGEWLIHPSDGHWHFTDCGNVIVRNGKQKPIRDLALELGWMLGDMHHPSALIIADLIDPYGLLVN